MNKMNISPQLTVAYFGPSMPLIPELPGTLRSIS